tara:strand:- start:2068 stop:2184 length:117 start_codon:yes stop_codon:yes gene_type:complete
MDRQEEFDEFIEKETIRLHSLVTEQFKVVKKHIIGQED